MRRIAALFSVLVMSAGALAQQFAPRMTVIVPGERGKPAARSKLRLSKLAVEARIFGALAETKMTMTFTNPHRRVLAGDLLFPLPQGATVSGYGLDVKGIMVDGVAVGKQRARVVFEKEVRKGVDPGLVEHVKGNNFRTRVFPIPAGGSRTVSVSYVSEIETGGDSARPAAPSYRLPLGFKDKVDDLSIRVEVVKATAMPVITKGGPAGLAFKKWRDSFVAESRLKDAALDQDVIVSLPELDKQKVLVEKADDGRYYFCISEAVSAEPPAAAANGPKHVAVFWDASASRGGRDHIRELNVLAGYFGRWRERKVAVDLVFIRNVAAKPRRFVVTGGNANVIIEAIAKVRYDGGTQIGALALPADRPPPDVCLLFTDGLSNIGREKPAGLKAPLYVFSDDTAANHSFLRYLAMSGGGQYFNLKRQPAAQVAQQIGRPAYSVQSARGDDAVADLLPGIREVIVGGRVMLTGRLTDKIAQVQFTCGYGGSGGERRAFQVVRAAAVEGNLLRRYWAQKKLAELMLMPERNREAIAELGKAHGLVTPQTSLIVLERLEQYVEHRIRPPKTLPKMRAEWERRMDSIEMQKKQAKQKNIERIVGLWKQLGQWWKKDFKYAKDFKYKPAAKAARGVAQLREMLTRLEAEKARLAASLAGASADRKLQIRRQIEQLEQQKRMLLAARERYSLGLRADARSAARAAEPSTVAPPPPARPAAPMPATPARRVEMSDLGGRLNVNVPSKADKAPRVGQPGIALKAWDPKTPYLSALRTAEPAKRFDVYLAQRKDYGTSPAFFLDCAGFFFQQKDAALGVQVLSNIAEMELENPALLRVLGHRLAQLGELNLAISTFEQVLRLRPEEPQSYRDLALVLAQRAKTWMALDTAKGLPRARKELRRAVELLYRVVTKKWDRFAEIELIALMELNALLPTARRAGLADTDIGVDPRLIALLDVDLRILLTWDADQTDIDLHVIEPSGEQVFYSHNRSAIGGRMSRDFTNGYGPEEYMVKKAMHGTYKIKAKYYGSRAAKLLGAVTVQLEIITHFGRATEKRKSITLRLKGKKEMIEVGEVEF